MMRCGLEGRNENKTEKKKKRVGADSFSLAANLFNTAVKLLWVVGWIDGGKKEIRRGLEIRADLLSHSLSRTDVVVVELLYRCFRSMLAF